jgi:hypothetical protein
MSSLISHYDLRTPRILSDSELLEILNGKKTNTFSFSQNIMPAFKIVSKDRCVISNTAYHALEKIECFASDILHLYLGTVLSGKEIFLKANIVKIMDEDFTHPIRTTLFAKQKITIEANTLYLDGADIPMPSEYFLNVKNFTFKNMTTSSAWIETIAKTGQGFRKEAVTNNTTMESDEKATVISP